MSHPIEQAVIKFHKAAKQPINTSWAIPNIKAIRFRQHFLLEEVLEGFQALLGEENPLYIKIESTLKQAQALSNTISKDDLSIDIDKFLDHLGDVQFVCQGTALYYGLNLPAGFEEIAQKNMTRFPKNQEELQATLEKANAEGVEVIHEFNDDLSVWAVLRADNGKVYKNALHKEPDFSLIIN